MKLNPFKLRERGREKERERERERKRERERENRKTEKNRERESRTERARERELFPQIECLSNKGYQILREQNNNCVLTDALEPRWRRLLQ